MLPSCVARFRALAFKIIEFQMSIDVSTSNDPIFLRTNRPEHLLCDFLNAGLVFGFEQNKTKRIISINNLYLLAKVFASKHTHDRPTNHPNKRPSGICWAWQGAWTGCVCEDGVLGIGPERVRVSFLGYGSFCFGLDCIKYAENYLTS